MTRSRIVLIIFVCIGILFLGYFLTEDIGIFKKDAIEYGSLPKQEKITLSPVTEVFITGPLVYPGTGGGEVTARAFLEASKDSLSLENPAYELSLGEHTTDEEGKEHISFSQKYQWHEVYGAGLIVHLEKETVLSASGRLIPMKNISLPAALVSMSFIRQTVLGLSTNFILIDDSEVFFNEGIITNEPSETRRAYMVEVADAERTKAFRYFVDASTGKILFEISLIQNASKEVFTYEMMEKILDRIQQPSCEDEFLEQVEIPYETLRKPVCVEVWNDGPGTKMYMLTTPVVPNAQKNDLGLLLYDYGGSAEGMGWGDFSLQFNQYLPMSHIEKDNAITLLADGSFVESRPDEKKHYQYFLEEKNGVWKFSEGKAVDINDIVNYDDSLNP